MSNIKPAWLKIEISNNHCCVPSDLDISDGGPQTKMHALKLSFVKQFFLCCLPCLKKNVTFVEQEPSTVV